MSFRCSIRSYGKRPTREPGNSRLPSRRRNSWRGAESATARRRRGSAHLWGKGHQASRPAGSPWERRRLGDRGWPQSPAAAKPRWFVAISQRRQSSSRTSTGPRATWNGPAATTSPRRTFGGGTPSCPAGAVVRERLADRQRCAPTSRASGRRRRPHSSEGTRPARRPPPVWSIRVQFRGEGATGPTTRRSQLPDSLVGSVLGQLSGVDDWRGGGRTGG